MLALALGAALYLGRGPTRGEAALGLDLGGARILVGPLVHRLPACVRDAGPDAAWSFALGSVLAAFAPSRAWLVTGFVLAIGLELAQAFHLLSGTFDVLDVLAITLGYLAALFSLTRRPLVAGELLGTKS